MGQGNGRQAWAQVPVWSLQLSHRSHRRLQWPCCGVARAVPPHDSACAGPSSRGRAGGAAGRVGRAQVVFGTAVHLRPRVEHTSPCPPACPPTHAPAAGLRLGTLDFRQCAAQQPIPGGSAPETQWVDNGGRWSEAAPPHKQIHVSGRNAALEAARAEKADGHAAAMGGRVGFAGPPRSVERERCEAVDGG